MKTANQSQSKHLRACAQITGAGASVRANKAIAEVPCINSHRSGSVTATIGYLLRFVGTAIATVWLFVVSPAWLEPLRYQPAATEKKAHSDELALLRIRYKEPGAEQSRLMEFPLKASQIKPSLKAASDDFRFAAAVAAYGQILKDSKYTGTFTLADVAELAQNAKGTDRFGLRAEFVQLVDLAKSLQTKAPRQD